MIRADDDEVTRVVERASRLLTISGAFLSEENDGYAIRTGPDRRRRPLQRLDEGAFRRLVKNPGLKPRPEGGWTALPGPQPELDRAGRPGRVEGEKAVVEDGGRVVLRRANLCESPIAWLARRKGPDGRPWLSAREVAAAERLRVDHERAGVIGRLTMDWDPGPRAGIVGPRLEPVERARAAKARVAAALEALGPGLAEMVDRVCLRGYGLEVAEKELRLAPRSGKVVLKIALGRLASHQGL